MPSIPNPYYILLSLHGGKVVQCNLQENKSYSHTLCSACGNSKVPPSFSRLYPLRAGDGSVLGLLGLTSDARIGVIDTESYTYQILPIFHSVHAVAVYKQSVLVLHGQSGLMVDHLTLLNAMALSLPFRIFDCNLVSSVRILQQKWRSSRKKRNELRRDTLKHIPAGQRIDKIESSLQSCLLETDTELEHLSLDLNTPMMDKDSPVLHAPTSPVRKFSNPEHLDVDDVIVSFAPHDMNGVCTTKSMLSDVDKLIFVSDHFDIEELSKRQFYNDFLRLLDLTEALSDARCGDRARKKLEESLAAVGGGGYHCGTNVSEAENNDNEIKVVIRENERALVDAEHMLSMSAILLNTIDRQCYDESARLVQPNKVFGDDDELTRSRLLSRTRSFQSSKDNETSVAEVLATVSILINQTEDMMSEFEKSHPSIIPSRVRSRSLSVSSPSPGLFRRQFGSDSCLVDMGSRDPEPSGSESGFHEEKGRSDVLVGEIVGVEADLHMSKLVPVGSSDTTASDSRMNSDVISSAGDIVQERCRSNSESFPAVLSSTCDGGPVSDCEEGDVMLEDDVDYADPEWLRNTDGVWADKWLDAEEGTDLSQIRNRIRSRRVCPVSEQQHRRTAVIIEMSPELEDTPDIIPERNTYSVTLSCGENGLGLNLRIERNHCLVVQAFNRMPYGVPNPAKQCGMIEIGDVLIAINGHKIIGMTSDEALEILKSFLRPCDEDVVLTFQYGDAICGPIRASPLVMSVDHIWRDSGGTVGSRRNSVNDDDLLECDEEDGGSGSEDGDSKNNPLFDLFATGMTSNVLKRMDEESKHLQFANDEFGMLDIASALLSGNIDNYAWRTSVGGTRLLLSEPEVIVECIKQRHMYPRCCVGNCVTAPVDADKNVEVVAEEVWNLYGAPHCRYKKLMARILMGESRAEEAILQKDSFVAALHGNRQHSRCIGYLEDFTDGCVLNMYAIESKTLKSKLRSSVNSSLMRSRGSLSWHRWLNLLNNDKSLPPDNDLNSEDEEMSDPSSHGEDRIYDLSDTVQFELDVSSKSKLDIISTPPQRSENTRKLANFRGSEQKKSNDSDNDVLMISDRDWKVRGLSKAIRVTMMNRKSQSLSPVPSSLRTKHCKTTSPAGIKSPKDGYSSIASYLPEVEYTAIVFKLVQESFVECPTIDPISGVDELLKVWMTSFTPLLPASPANREKLQGVARLNTKHLSSDASSGDNAFRLHTTCVTCLVTVFFLIHTVLPYIVKCNGRRNIKAGLCGHFYVLPNTFKQFSIDISVPAQQLSSCSITQWDITDVSTFFESYANYVDLDVYAIVCCVRQFSGPLSKCTDLACRAPAVLRCRNPFLSSAVEGGSSVSNKNTPVSADASLLFQSFVLENKIPNVLNVFLANLTAICRASEFQCVTLCCNLFPYIQPWNIRTAILDVSGGSQCISMDEIQSTERYLSSLSTISKFHLVVYYAGIVFDSHIPASSATVHALLEVSLHLYSNYMVTTLSRMSSIESGSSGTRTTLDSDVSIIDSRSVYSGLIDTATPESGNDEDGVIDSNRLSESSGNDTAPDEGRVEKRATSETLSVGNYCYVMQIVAEVLSDECLHALGAYHTAKVCTQYCYFKGALDTVEALMKCSLSLVTIDRAQDVVHNQKLSFDNREICLAKVAGAESDTALVCWIDLVSTMLRRLVHAFVILEVENSVQNLGSDLALAVVSQGIESHLRHLTRSISLLWLLLLEHQWRTLDLLVDKGNEVESQVVNSIAEILQNCLIDSQSELCDLLGCDSATDCEQSFVQGAEVVAMAVKHSIGAISAGRIFEKVPLLCALLLS
eukprot:CAMPEP_0185043794 /NCGR_PEP_ID=MMETSP1103-20130426/43101_1 /TAXON_ID=36769 /ORGANISM="Paraphysomonas bandaiensis, Strain Caron Lab Isolate" /LENGTH=1808 /DNA_ID=CAMNT_0027584011 /DNA_START=814 /DNA_END=6240 /DNA_ORIENTATION=+